MNEHPPGQYSAAPASDDLSRSSTPRIERIGRNSDNNENEEDYRKTESTKKRQELQLKTRRISSDLPRTESLNIIKKKSNVPRNKRKSLPLQKFENEERRNRKMKRRYSDISEFKSSRIRLSSLETDQSRSPHNKRRRISDVRDIFEIEKHDQYEIQGIGHILNTQKLTKANLLRFNQRSKIREIINSNDVIVAITKHGLAAAFNRSLCLSFSLDFCFVKS